MRDLRPVVIEPAAYPTFRVAVVFASLSPDLPGRLEMAAAIEPGASFEILVAAEEALPSGSFDLVVHSALAESRRPRALARLVADCARRGAELVRIPVGTPELADELPRRLRLAQVPALTPPCAVRFATSSQRSFAFDALTGVSKVRLPPAGPAVSLRRIERGVRLETEGRTPRRAVTLRWGCEGVEVECFGPGERAGPPSELSRGLSVREPSDGPLARFADEVAGPAGGPRLALEALVRRARVWLVRAMPAHARRVARPFHPDVQPLVVTSVAADPTGRVAQLATVCPGIFALARTWPSDGFAEVLRRTIAGETLVDAAAPMLDRWAFHLRRQPASERHLRFVRRASAGVEPGSLAFPFPRGVVLDDVPVAPSPNEAWFRAIGVLASLAIAPGHEGYERLGPFVSARGAELGTLSESALANLLRRLRLRGVRLGRWPGRRTTVEAAIRAVRPWPESEHGGAPSRVVLAPPTNPGLVVRRLETAADLAAEGEEMHHCVTSHVDSVESGEILAVSLRFGAERLTATLTPMEGSTIVLDHLAGFANAEPSVEAARAVEAWLAERPQRG
ncbi:MAG: hypothetical protein OHK0013_11880 [Sandaracinaceae bacterium]